MKVEAPPKWTTLQVSWLALWVVSAILSITYYVPKIVDARKQANSTCTLGGIGNTLTNLIKPEYWLGLFTIFITIIGAQFLLRKAGSKWAWVDDYKLFGATVLALLILLFIHAGCSR